MRLRAWWAYIYPTIVGRFKPTDFSDSLLLKGLLRLVKQHCNSQHIYSTPVHVTAMAFDKSLDKELFSESVTFDATKLTVSVFSYNGGRQKLQISRENIDTTSGDWKFAKLGRMLREEVEAVLPLMQKAIQHMDGIGRLNSALRSA